MEETEKVTRKKKYEPTDDDYELSGIRVEEAENGVLVICELALNDDAKDKIKSHPNSGNYVPYDTDHKTERHVFEKIQDAKDFCNEQIDELFKDRMDTEEGEEDDD